MNWKKILTFCALAIFFFISSESISAQSISLPNGTLTNTKYCTWFGGYWDGQWTSSTIDAQNDTVVINGVISGISLHDAFLEVGLLTDRQYNFIMNNHPTEPEDWFNQGAYMLFYTWTSGGNWSWGQIQDYQSEGSMVPLPWVTSYNFKVVFKPNLGSRGGTADLYMNGVLVESNHVYGKPQTPGWWASYDTTGEEDFSAAHLIIQLWANSSGKSVSYSDLRAQFIPPEVWVDDDYNSSTPGWGYDHFDKIQDGVDAVASGGTAHVYSGNYIEQLTIQKDLTLEGVALSPKPKIIAPAVRAPAFQIAESGRWWDPVIFMGNKAGAATFNITVKGFEIDGQNLGTAASTFVALLARNVNPGMFRDCDVHDFHNPANSDRGSGLMIYGNSNMTVISNTVSAFSKNGITANGDFAAAPDPVVIIDSNNVTGDGYIAAVAQNGIQVGYGAGGTVHANLISNIGWIWNGSGTQWVSSGILPAVLGTPGPSVNCTDNVITDVQVGIYYSDGTGNATGNRYTMTNSDGLGPYVYYSGILACDPLPSAPVPKALPFEDKGIAETPEGQTLYKTAAILTYDISNNIVIGDGKTSSEGIYFYNWSGGAHTLVGTAADNTVKGFGSGLNSHSDGSTLNITFHDNLIECNQVVGIYLAGGTTGSSVYNNKLIGNVQNAQDDGIAPNAWDNGSTGNFWGDWASNSGFPTQYNVPGTAGSVDHYPLPNPSVVWVDDDWAGTPCGDSVGGHLFGYDAFAEIQDGIIGVGLGGLVHVADGSYEPFSVQAKALIINGDGPNVIVSGNQTVNTNYGARTTIVFVENSSDAIMRNLKIEGPSLDKPRYGIIIEDSKVRFVSGLVSPHNVAEWANGCAVGIWGTAEVDVESTAVNDYGKAGIFYYGPDGAKGKILNCTVAGVVLNDSLRLTNAVEIDYGAEVEVRNTEVYNSKNLHPNPAWASIGILSYGWDTPTKAKVINCNIHDNDYGISTDAGAAGSSKINFNNIFDNVKYGVDNAETAKLDAMLNFWGAYSGPTLPAGLINILSAHASSSPTLPDESIRIPVKKTNKALENNGGLLTGKVLGSGDQISTYVAHSPWLGFTFSTVPMTFHNDTTGKIQVALDVAVNNDTVKVHEGVFNENLTVKSGIFLLGAGQTLTTIYPAISDLGQPNPQDPPSFRGSQMCVVKATNVTIDGFTFDGDSPTLTPPGTIDARNGIITEYATGDWSNLKVQNCTVKNIYLRGIYASAQTPNNLTGVDFNHNTVSNVKGWSEQSAGIMLWGSSGNAKHNNVSDASLGIFYHWYSDGNIDSNNVTTSEVCLGANSNDAVTSISYNTVTNSPQGIQTVSTLAPINVTFNNVTDCTTGVVLYGGGTAQANVWDNNIKGLGYYSTYGVWASTDLTPWGLGSVSANLKRNTIIDNFYGMVLNEPSGDRSATVSVLIGGAPTDRNFIYNNNNYELLLEYCNDNQTATYNYWGKSSYAQIEDEIYHKVDQPDLGLVTFGNAILHGDVNLDGHLSVADVVYLVNYLFKGGPAPQLFVVADVNRDGKLTVADAVYLINYLFKGGPAPKIIASESAAPGIGKITVDKPKLSKPVNLHSVEK